MKGSNLPQKETILHCVAQWRVRRCGKSTDSMGWTPAVGFNWWSLNQQIITYRLSCWIWYIYIHMESVYVCLCAPHAIGYTPLSPHFNFWSNSSLLHSIIFFCACACWKRIGGVGFVRSSNSFIIGGNITWLQNVVSNRWSVAGFCFQRCGFQSK